MKILFEEIVRGHPTKSPGIYRRKRIDGLCSIDLALFNYLTPNLESREIWIDADKTRRLVTLINHRVVAYIDGSDEIGILVDIATPELADEIVMELRKHKELYIDWCKRNQVWP